MGARAVFLVGFMASGKTTVGKALASRLGWDFVDLDSRIETRERQSIPEIFRERGEPGFRRAETAALQHLTRDLEHNSVVALGGGVFAQDCNRELLRGWPTVFLSAPIDELWRRSQEDETERPLRKSRDQFAQLYAERFPSYEQATFTVETAGKDASLVAAEIELVLGHALASNPGRDDAFRPGYVNSNRGNSK
jgi:shikimate kinase